MGAKAHQIAQAAQAELEARPVRNVGVQTKQKGMSKLTELEVLATHAPWSRDHAYMGMGMATDAPPLSSTGARA